MAVSSPATAAPAPALDAHPRLRINWPAAVVLLVLPVLLTAALVVYGLNVGFTWGFFALAIVAYYGSNISVGIGLHRYFAHASYTAPKWVEWLLLIATVGPLQGPVMAWVSDHARHHSFTDRERDPHSPLRYRSRLAGFLWAHMGWMLVKEADNKSIERGTIVRFGRNEAVLWQMRHYWKLAWAMNLGLPAIVGALVFGWSQGPLLGAVSGVLAVNLGRTLQQHATFFVNSLCHITGAKRYVDGTAGDIWWLAPLLLGENWHNFHHAFARDYRNGHRWYHLDVHKWIIAAMARLGMARDLVRTDDDRVSVKMEETACRVAESRSELPPRLHDLRARLEQATGHARETLAQLRDAAREARGSAGTRLGEVHDRLHQLLDEAQREIWEARARLASLRSDGARRVEEAKNQLIDVAHEAQLTLNEIILRLSGPRRAPGLARSR